MPFVKLTVAADLPPTNEAKEFSCNGKEICVANVDGIYTAMHNICPHRGGPLGQGMIERGKLICPWHAWAWDTKTGATDQNPNMNVAIYPIRIEDGDVLIEL